MNPNDLIAPYPWLDKGTLIKTLQMINDMRPFMEETLPPSQPKFDPEDFGEEMEEFDEFELMIDRMSPEELLRFWRGHRVNDTDQMTPKHSQYVLDAVAALSYQDPKAYAEADRAVGFTFDYTEKDE